MGPLEGADFRLDWIVRVDQPLVLISQVQRAGGTLMARLFDDHPACHAHPYELKWGRPRKWDWPDLDLTLSPSELSAALRENWVEEFARLGAYQKHIMRPKGGFLAGFETQPFLFDLKLQLLIFDKVLSGQRPATQRDVLNAHMTALFNAWLDYQNLYHAPKQFVTAFTPQVNMHEESRRRFRRDYPDGHLLTIVREPISWLASSLGHTNVDFADVGSSVELWIQSAEASLAAWEENKARTMVLLFEDIIGRTEDTMRAVASHLGMEWRPSLACPTYNGRPVASDSSFVASTAIDPSVVDRRPQLDAATMADVRARTLPLYERVRRQFGLQS